MIFVEAALFNFWWIEFKQWRFLCSELL
jgi:hypothetical protein